MGNGEKRSQKKAGFDRQKAAKELARGGKLSRAEVLRCRVRYFTDGAVIGGREYVEGVFSALRDRFGPKRKDGARRMRGCGEGMFALRDLRQGLFG